MSLPPVKGAANNASRIRVHDAALHTEVMNAADWGRAVAAEERRRRAVRDGAAEEPAGGPVVLRVAGAEEERRKKQKAGFLAEQREEAKFMRRMKSFMRRHRELVVRCAQQQQRDTASWQRTVSEIYSSWEEEVLQPVQDFIDAELRDVQKTQERALLRRKMMSAFIAECNRVSRLGNRHSVYRDIIDEVRYNPQQQLKNTTIYYPAPPARETTFDRRRREAQEVWQKYTELARNYRALARESTTGLLSPAPVVPHATWDAHRTQQMSACGTILSSIDPPRVNTTEPRSLPGTSLYQGKENDSFAGVNHRAKGGCAAVVPPQEPAGSQNKNEHHLSGSGKISSDALAEWMLQRRVPKPRGAELPVTAWEKFQETLCGWMVTAEGDMKESCERRKRCALKTQKSNVVFDDFTFLRGIEGPLRTGKRVV